MSGGGADAPPPNGGEFLLQLLRKPPNNSHHPTHAPPQTFSHDSAIAAVGPSAPTFSPLQSNFHYSPWNLSSSPHIYFQQNPNPNPNLNPDFAGFGYPSHQFNLQQFSDERLNLGFVSSPQQRDLVFGNFTHDSLGQKKDSRLNGLNINSVVIDEKARGNGNNGGKTGQNGNYRMAAPPPGFSSKIGEGNGNVKKLFDQNADKGKGDLANSDNRVHFAGSLTREKLRSDLGNAIKGMLELRIEDVGNVNGQELRDGGRGKVSEDRGGSHLDDLEDQLVSSLGLEDESGKKNDKKKHHRDKDYRSDKRGQWIMGQRMRNQKSFTSFRSDINRPNAPFLALFQSLIPPDEEKVKQKQLLTVLEKLVHKEWPEARLCLYGSCANSFGFSKSDIDVCLSMELGNAEKSEVLLKLADIFLSDNLQNVQALTRARVPIVKLMDPVTGISCDICINNVLAVVNTKLLRDYAKIDSRLRQLVFLVKHWAKSRGVNETYQGTLSSYAYVLMCIHFLQQRRPAILPCLQGMEITYYEIVDNVECAYFDQVDKLCNFGSQNRESIAQLVWGFFHYWAYCHDYANDVISVRTGHTISKRAKDWTKRVGNDRHLICIEDPFEASHDLGRVVDKFSIRVLREEFERAAHIMQYDPNPCVTLFEPYIPE